MEKEKFQRYVASLEQVVRNSHLDLRETMNQFKEYSMRFSMEQDVPPGIITDIRNTYKGIHDQLTKIKGINQLLETKYRQYYRRDHQRDKEIAEFTTLSKNLYARFESTLEEVDDERSQENKQEGEAPDHRMPFQWFRSMDNQFILLKNLQDLYALNYKTGPESDVNLKQRVTQHKLRSLSLFALSGEEGFIETLESRMRLREYDIKERYAEDELRGALTHLKEISAPEVKGVLKRFIDSREVLKLKCLLLSIQSYEDLEKETLGCAHSMLGEMRRGEVRALQI